VAVAAKIATAATAVLAVVQVEMASIELAAVLRAAKETLAVI
jgi:hypothetical protein